jgi:hypothetical protein
MPEESNTITIARPVGDVFAFLANAENNRRWRSGVIEMTRTGGQGVGTTYRQVVAGPGGRRIDSDVEINNFAANNRPGAILFVTPNWDAGGVCGCIYDSSPVGVWYDNGSSRWAIFNENKSAMTAGASFNVMAWHGMALVSLKLVRSRSGHWP